MTVRASMRQAGRPPPARGSICSSTAIWSRQEDRDDPRDEPASPTMPVARQEMIVNDKVNIIAAASSPTVLAYGQL